ncbi:LysR family transcriptional regulator [Bilifractor sp. HCP3S3_D3]|uniref:LysR family transcriptional regulator n=1 Tax=unclassified Bilifractor TaxID=2815795 RepID=UPI003F89422B
MNLKDMECFIEVCEKKSITAAAEAMFLSPQAVSQTIRRMEEEVGAELLVRSQKGVALNEYGKIFYDHACRIIADYNGMTASISDLKKQEKGFLRLVSAYGVLRLLSPEFIHTFTDQNPGVRLDYMEFPDIYIEENVRNRKYDLGFVPYVKKDPELKYIPLFSREIFFITHRKSRYYDRNEVSVKEISEEPVIIENGNFMIHHILEETCRKEGADLDVYFNTSGFSLCYKLCREQEGNTVSMDFIFEDMGSDDLRKISFAEHPLWKVAAVVRKDMPQTDNVRKLIDFAVEWCATI